jgi:hypothetical protein
MASEHTLDLAAKKRRERSTVSSLYCIKPLAEAFADILLVEPDAMQSQQPFDPTDDACMRRRPSSATSLPSPFFFSRSQPEDVDLGSFGRGQALQRIALYPVRVRTPSSHNQYSRLPKA